MPLPARSIRRRFVWGEGMGLSRNEIAARPRPQGTQTPASGSAPYSEAASSRPAERSVRSVCILQNSAVEPPGLIDEVLRREGWQPRLIRCYRRDAVPPDMGVDRGLVIMGGPMGVGEEQKHPCLAAELALIADALARRIPVLGICLGSQLIAAAAGAAVVAGPRREIGWHPVPLTRAAHRDPLFAGLPATLTTFHWHGDHFHLPKGAVSLARSAMTECQAFRYGSLTYGLLFHLEVSAKCIVRMTEAFQAELFSTGQRSDEIVESIPRFFPTAQEIGRTVFGRWVRLLEKA